MQAFAPLFSSAKRNCQLRVYTLLIKKVANTHFKCIRDLMHTFYGDIPSTVYPVVYGLPTNANPLGKYSITYIFFIITRRKFNCDS